MVDFDWPWEYNFPPFFTLQPNDKTQQQQISVWASLVIKYQKYKNDANLNLNEDSPLFHNKDIKRSLPLEARILVLEAVQKSGHGQAIDKRKTQWQVYWHTLQEWAKIIYDWASETGQTNSVCTLYEIANGDGSAGQEFHELDQDVILKALRALESKGKCELMLFDDSQGVKFF